MASTEDNKGAPSAAGQDFKSSVSHKENIDTSKPESPLEKVLDKLRLEPGEITSEDARRLHEHYDAVDEPSARVISAVEALGAAHDDIALKQGNSQALKGSGHASLDTLVKDLVAAVDKNPQDVTVDVLKTNQGVVSKMQKAIGTANAPHPELEAELQQEYAKIEPKVEQGTVTKAEADHLHSLESRAHGHTEKGGLTAIAQSVAAKRERALSLSNNSNNPSSEEDLSVRNLTPQEQSVKDKESNLEKDKDIVGAKIDNEPEKVTKEDAALLESLVDGRLLTEAQWLAENNVVEKGAEIAAPLEDHKGKAGDVVEEGHAEAGAESQADKNPQDAASTK